MKSAMALLVVLVALCLVFASEAANPPPQVARKENVKFIRCAVCEQIAKQLSLQIARKRESLHPKKLSEFHVIEVAENLCNLKKEEAEWMFHLDIVQQGNTAKLVEHEEEGECGTKCKTVARACQEVLGDHDTDIAEFIFLNRDSLNPETISNALCKDLSGACTRPPLVPKNTDFGEPFAPKSKKDAEMERLMRSMSGMPGAPGMKMYSKDDLANMRGLGGEDEDDEEEQDDEQAADFSSLLKQTNTEAVTQQERFKQRISSLLEGVSKTIKSQVQYAARRGTRFYNKAVRSVRKWMKNRAAKSEVRQRAEL